MKSNAYLDKRSIMQVLGCLKNNPNLLTRTDKYEFNEDDFAEDFYILIFGILQNLKAQGLKKIDLLDIDNYLSTRPGAKKLYEDNRGAEYVSEISKISDISKFDYYYQRLKKMTLLRMYVEYGVDISWLYNPNTLDIQLKQKQEDWLDSVDRQAIVTAVNKKFKEIESKYLNSIGSDKVAAGHSIFELIEDLKTTPEVGIPMFGPLINTITRGARLKKFYLRSSPTGTGKTRMMIADACNFACDEIYDIYEQKWIPNGTSEPTLYITTEQELDEIQTMMLAFISGVDENRILTGRYLAGEEDRVKYAAEVIKRSPLWIEEMHDFSLDDVENKIRSHVIDGNVKYVVFDYIHTSLKIMEEISRKTGGIRLREDQILYMLAIRLKDIANELGIFVLSSTQLNADWESSKNGNQNLLRGSKAIADKIDFGAIVLPVTDDDLKALQPLLSSGAIATPNLVYHIYKNRRSQHANAKLWCSADMSICRVTPIFLTDNNYKVIPLENYKIIVEDDDTFEVK